MGHCNDGIVAHLSHLKLPVVHPFTDLAAETDLHRVVLPGTEPDIAHFQPVVREFHLPAVDDLLAENAEFIADGIAGDGIAHTGGGVHIARGQTSQTAVAQTCVRLQGIDPVDIEADLFQALPDLLLHAKIEQIVAQTGADQELHGHIIDFLLFVAGNAVVKSAILLRQDLPQHIAQGAIDLLFRGVGQPAAKESAHAVLQLFHHIRAGFPAHVNNRFFGCLLLHGSS